MPSLLWTSYLRYLRRNSWLLFLSMSAVAVGVAVVLAIDIASTSARLSFALSTEALIGRSNYSVTSSSNLPSEFYRRLRVDWGYRRSAPVMEGYVAFPSPDGSGESLALTLLGVDPFADRDIRSWTSSRLEGSSGGLGRLVGAEDNVVSSSSTARRLNWQVGEEREVAVGLERRRLMLAGVFSAQSERSNGALDNMLLTDISVAQRIFGRFGMIDRIDLVLEPGEEDVLKAKLPEGYFLSPSGQSRQTASELSSAFHLNLRALSYLCLLVGVFLIFNVVAFTVSHRRQALARLRILGVTSGELARLLLGEALVLGVLGSVVGCALGLLLGRGLVPLVTRTLNDLYYVHSITGFAIDSKLILKAFFSGLVACLAAASVPAYLAAREEPLDLLHRVSDPDTQARGAGRWFMGGFVSLVVASALLLHPSLWAALLSLLLTVLGYALWIPALLSLTVRLGSWTVRGVSAKMAFRGVSAFLGRTSIATVSLTVAVAATISIALMVSSFRGTLTRWLDTTLTADIYLSLRNRSGHASGLALPELQVQRALALDGVEDWVGQRLKTVDSSTGETLLIGVRTTPKYRSSLVFLEHGEQHWTRFERGEGVFVTEPYARRAKLSAGSSLWLATPHGGREVEILGVYYSYAPDRNTALASHRLLVQEYGDAMWSGLGLFLKPGADSVELVGKLRRLFGEQVEVRATGSLKRLALEIFERTFTVTEVLRGLALGVAFLGVFLSLLALAYERSQEVRVLRALGFGEGELFRLSLGQSVLLGLAGGIFALPLGVVLSRLMISAINQRAFGWTITFEMDYGSPVTGIALALLAAVAAGLYPAWKWSRESEGEALRERE